MSMGLWLCEWANQKDLFKAYAEHKGCERVITCYDPLLGLYWSAETGAKGRFMTMVTAKDIMIVIKLHNMNIIV